MMEEGVGEELMTLDTDEVSHLENKARQEAQQDNEYSLKPETCNMLESREMLIPIEGDYSQGYPQEFTEILEGKSSDRNINHFSASEQPFSSPRCMDDGGVMVEELTVKNYDGSNLAIVGTSNNRGRMLARQNRWMHLYQLANGSGSGTSYGDTSYKDTGPTMSGGLEDVGHASYLECLGRKPVSDDGSKVLEEFANAESKGDGDNNHGGIRTKILSKSGFSEFFVKRTLKGKGVVHRGPSHGVFHVEPRNHNNNARNAPGTIVASDAPLKPAVKTVMPSAFRKSEPRPSGSTFAGVNLREWLKVGQHKLNIVECLYIFKQIVELVNNFHSQGVALHDLRPSSFRLLASKEVKYLGSSIQGEMLESGMDKDFPYPDKSLIRKRPLDQGPPPSFSSLKKQKFINNSGSRGQWPHFPSRSGSSFETASAREFNIPGPQNSPNECDEHYPSTEHGSMSKSTGHVMTKSAQITPACDRLEEKWYASPEELNEGRCTTYSNIYSLGILLFELLGRFNSDKAHAAAMSDLRHRILPPNFLSEYPREAGFCLWLLHPESTSRPTTREILEFELISGLPEALPEELSASNDQDDAESELLLEFLISLREQKQKDAAKLVEDVRCLEVDIEEVEKRCSSSKPLVHSRSHAESMNGQENLQFHARLSSSDVLSQVSSINTNDVRLERNITQLEKVYFSMRPKIQHSENDAPTRTDNDLLRTRESWYLTHKDEEKRDPTDSLGVFFDGFCKYSRYRKFEVRGVLRNGDFNSSSNVICSLSFDRDEDHFAAAGVSKKIKIFEYNALFNEAVDIHYPVVEMLNKSKLSCVSWNKYIKNYLASTDYDGVIKLWDACTGQETSQYTEHERRAWSVDFSPVYPTKLASGSDDCSVKLWSINEKNCLGTIRNIANVCCVRFSSHSSQLLAFGSADYRTYCYDLRNTRVPWCVLGGHEKAVSYVKFLDSETLVSASTDNTLKLWNLNRTNPSGLSTNACSLTLGGHTNEKNFVGLSVSDGYIACGSETNEVYAYHRSLPMPITSHKFGSIDPITGKEIDDDNGQQFVSSVCWRGKSDTVVAANSTGCIKVLQMV